VKAFGIDNNREISFGAMCDGIIAIAKTPSTLMIDENGVTNWCVLWCSFSFARLKENEPKEKDAVRKFFTSRATASADDFVSPTCFPTCSTKSFTAPTDGTKFSQGAISFCAWGNRNRRRMGWTRSKAIMNAGISISACFLGYFFARAKK
jgi:hypothetical protein